jgi:long-chain acyl-CoA synthetase
MRPVIRTETLYGDRQVQCYGERPRNLAAMLGATALRHPAQQALAWDGRHMSYAELDQAASRLAAGLAARGIGRGERVALFMGNRPEFVVALCALWRLGAIAVPIGIKQSRYELSYMLNHCGAAALLYEQAHAERIPALSELPALRLCLSVDRAGSGGDEPSADYAALARSGLPGWSAPVFDDQSPACIMYTSGTTGQPKGAVLSHLGFFHTARNYQLQFGYVAGDRILLAIPGSHISGLLAVVVVALQAGAAIVLMRDFKAAAMLDLIEREQVTATVLVPAMYNLCALDPTLGQRRLDHWRIGHFGGAAMPAVTIEKLAALLPELALYNGYGATETTSAVTLTARGEAVRQRESVGCPLPCIELRIANESGQPCEAGETGEIWVRGPGIAIGYWEQPDATAAAFSDGYWRSGDIGRLDPDGRLLVLDRMKDMINRGGYKIYSIEVENVVQRMEGVIEVAVVPHPCPVLGERIHVFARITAPLDLDSVRAFCRPFLADYKLPDYLSAGPEPLPRNLNGKLTKQALREALRAQASPPTPGHRPSPSSLSSPSSLAGVPAP